MFERISMRIGSCFFSTHHQLMMTLPSSTKKLFKPEGAKSDDAQPRAVEYYFCPPHDTS